MYSFLSTYSVLKTGLAGLGFLLVTISAPYAAENNDVGPGPAMWKLQTDRATVYLLGSFAALSPQTEWRDARVNHALKDSDAVYFEIDDREMDDPAVKKKVLSQTFLPEATKLSEILDTEIYGELSQALVKLDVPEAEVETMTPLGASTLQRVYHAMDKGLFPRYGVSSSLRRAAIESGKPVRALETGDRLFTLLDARSTVASDYLLSESLRYIRSSELIDQEVNAWLSGQTDVFDTLVLERIRQHPKAYKTLIKDRNRDWATQIEADLNAGGTYFVVVGAIHLVGPDSVIQMLKDKGYEVERY